MCDFTVLVITRYLSNQSIFIKNFLGVTWLIGEYANVSTSVSILFYREQFTDDEKKRRLSKR